MLTCPTPSRLHGLDALRAGALLLGVVLHACMSYMPGSQFFWITSDATSSSVASGTFFWIHSFRMLLFFFLAGYFGHVLVQRHGIPGFLRNRFKRVLVPLLIGWPLVLPAIVAVIVWSAWVSNGGQLPAQSPPGPTFTPNSFPLTHLWFLYVLSLFYVAAAGIQVATRRFWRRAPPPAPAGLALNTIAGHLGRWVVVVPMVAGLLMLPKWMPWFGIPTPDQSLYPNIAALMGFGSAFVFGWVVHVRDGALARVGRSWRITMTLAIATTAACLAWVGPNPSFDVAVAGLGFKRAAFAALYSISGWAWVFALTGLVLATANRPSRSVRYVADASLWIYLAHLPLVAAGQVVMSQLDGPIWLELPAIVICTLALLLATWHVAIRGSRLGRALGLAPGRAAVARTEPAGAVSNEPLRSG